jgi:hypothetical protein
MLDEVIASELVETPLSKLVKEIAEENKKWIGANFDDF